MKDTRLPEAVGEEYVGSDIKELVEDLKILLQRAQDDEEDPDIVEAVTEVFKKAVELYGAVAELGTALIDDGR